MSKSFRRPAALCGLLLLALRPVVAPAQGISVGVQAGGSRSTLRVADLPSGARDGGVAGLAVALEFRPWLAGDVEALFVEKGTAGPGEFDLRARYLEVPLLVRVTSPRAAWGFAPFAQAGVAPALELACGGRTYPVTIQSPLALSAPGTVPLDCAGYRTDRLDAGVVLGAGIARRVGPVQLRASLRTTRGVRDIGSGFEFTTVRNRSTALLVGATMRVR